MFTQTEVGEGDAPVVFVQHHVTQLQVPVYNVSLFAATGTGIV